MKFVIKVLYDTVLLSKKEPHSSGFFVVLTRLAFKAFNVINAFTVFIFAFSGSIA